MFKIHPNIVKTVSKTFKSGNFCSKPKPVLRKPRTKIQIDSFGWGLLLVPVSTFALGTWQIQRKTWKEGLIRDLKTRTESDPVALPDNLDEVNKLEYYPVHVRGHFIHDKEIHMGPRTLLAKGDAVTESALISKDQNKTQGYLVITPFKLEGKDETILINRGWVPSQHKDPKSRQDGQIEGIVNVIGLVRLHENRPNFMPANRESNNAWFYRDLHQMSSVTGAAPIFLDATTDFASKNGPIAGQTRVTMRNEHLSYIMTWYTLSMLTSYMWYKQFIRV